jgi:hypothetical protein
MVLFTGGPYVPGLPPKAKPAKPKVTAKPVNTTTLAGVLAASRPKPPSTPRVFIPELATPEQRATLPPSVAAQALAVQRPTTTRTTSTTGTGGSSATGSIETGIVEKTTGGSGSGGAKDEGAGAEKPLEVTLDQEDMDAAQAAADALRDFQETQARMQLQQVLGKIDRAAIEQYKGISEDYAARGLARSGAKLQTEQKAIDERDRAVGEAKQAVTDFLDELKYTGNLEQAVTNLGKSRAFQDYITGRLSPAMGE